MIWLRIILIAVLALGAFVTGYRTGANGVQRDWDAERHAQVAAHLAAVEQNQQTITDLEIKHAKVTADLEYLRAHPAGRVRLPPKTPCPSVPNPTSGVSIPAPSAERASDPAQDALGETQSGMESDANEWARALNACQVVMDWAKSLKTAGTR